ncbi:uncharacterized protein [Pyxicephalus adspersus]|uniref:uncharacterized protein n=1 Tax=Pyxicephalus adspersus TaxID=30357 RepID=UPI003B5CB4B6
MGSIKFVPHESLGPKWHPIGQGHFGDVYKVKHNQLKLNVAVKKLKENTSYILNELIAEAEKIKHASDNYFVIKLLGIVKTPPCIVMELMEYGCLGSLMERVEEIPWPLKYRILHEVALGMNWLHSLCPPLLHLDLKPRNVLLNDALHIRITDFGLSKYTSSSSILADSGTVGGTLEYMPPEAFQEGYQPSTSTDIYSFAILSAVVLRGYDPYPVLHSELISISIPQGQRPSFDCLENIGSVKNLDMAIAFTKRCWDNDKGQRPSFEDCCHQWENIISAYEDKEIKDAVKAVVNMMDSTDSSGSKAEVNQGASAVNTKDMSDLIKQMESLNTEEHPSAKPEAVLLRNPNQSYHRVPVQNLPPANVTRTSVNTRPSTSNPRTGFNPLRNTQKIRIQHGGPTLPNVRQTNQPRQAGPNHRTNSTVYMTGNVRGPQTAESPMFQPMPPHMFPNHQSLGNPFFQPGFHPHPAYFHLQFPPQSPQTVNNIILNNNTGPCQIGNNNELFIGTTGNPPNTYNPRTEHPGLINPTYSPAQSSNIFISNSTGGLQIGNNNRMVHRKNQNHGSNTKPINPQRGQTTSTRYPAKSVPSPQVQQASLPTKTETFLDAAVPIEETAKQSNQPVDRPTTQDITVNNLPQGKDTNSSSSPQEQKNNSKQ